MTEQSHRPEPEKGPIGQLVRLFLTQLLAVVAIATVITVVVAWTGAGLDDDVTATPAGVSDSPEPAENERTPATTSTPAPSSTSATPDAATSSAAASSTPAESLPRVDVLNQSAAGGSAAQTADQLRAAGWRIGRVDDFRGNVSETTIYFPPGLRPEARQLRGDLPGSLRLQPAFSTLKAGRLSVILVD